MFIGIGQRAFGWCGGNAKVIELAARQTQSIADFSETFGLSKRKRTTAPTFP
jgi:hypothetical protein